MTQHDELAVDAFAPSFAQERLWFMEQLVPGTAAYVLATTVRLRGRLDPALLQCALDAAAARHDSARTRFPRTTDGRPIAEIATGITVPMRIVDAANEEQARAIVADAANTPFDLTAAPLLRTLLIRLGPDDHVLQLAMHHIVSDGWSMNLFLGEVRAAYGSGGHAPPAPTVSYRDYAAAQRNRIGTPGAEDGGDGLNYWTTALAGVPPLELPADRPRPPEQSFDAGHHRFEIPAELAGKLRQMGRALRATPYMILLAGLQAVLFRYTGQRDFAIGSPVAGRPLPELENVVGLFVNTIALRADLSLDGGAEPSFAALLRRTRGRALQAMAHQEVPFERLVQELNVVRDVSRTPIFQVMFALQNFSRSTAAWPEGLLEESFGSGLRSTRFDLSFYINEHPDGGLRGSLFYNDSVFDAATMRRLARHYVALLAAAAAQPEAALADLELLDTAEHAEVLRFATPDPVPPSPAIPGGASNLAGLIMPFASATPRAAAVVCGTSSISYRELDQKANRLARFLRERGVGPDSLVGVCLEQSVDLAVALLGVLRAGGAYVPLDPEQPPARLGAMVADAGLTLALTTTELRHHLELAGMADPVCLDRVSKQIAAFPAGPLEATSGPGDLAYVIYTSGSTGAPKGVAAPHRPLLRYLDGVASRFGIVPASRYVLLQSMSFDFSVTVFYLALATGGTVHLVPRRSSGSELAGYLKQHKIDYYKITPSHFAALAADIGPEALLPKRALIFGGEAASLPWAARLATQETAVFNHYGPTETTVGATTYRILPGDTGSGMVPIGQPLPHTRVYVLDVTGRPAPIGVPGEIHIGGDRLARGYLGRPELTGEKFILDPFSDMPGARMYRTGDLGRWRPDGNLEFLGRRDHQIKIRGYRVELGEVEAALAACPAVVQAVAVLRGDRLVGYLETEPGCEPAEPGEMRRLLADRLPDYMIPNRFVWLDRLPLQDHGKVDRAALPPPPDDRPDGGSYVAPQGPVESTIAEVWQRLLGVDRVGAADDFFDLGGHSLLATQVVAVLRRELPDGRPVSAMDLFKHRTVRELAALATGSIAGAAAGGLLHELTRPVEAPTRTLLCVPYGGGSAVVYQPLADALPAGHRLLSVAMPGHDIGLADDPMPLPEVAAAVAAEVLSTVDGQLAIYGHCGPGGAVAVEIARLLEAAGREVETVYLGAVFPFARPVGGLIGPLARLRIAERIRSDHLYRTWLQAQGTDLGTLDAAQGAFIIRAMRHDARASEDYFTELVHRNVVPLRAPIVSIVGERDRSTEYHQERYREWQFLSERTALKVIDEGGHYFLKYRADELAGIVTSAAAEPPAPPALPASANAPEPSMARFLTIALGQIVTTTGSALTTFALPLSVYLETGSLTRFALFAILGIVPGLLIAPVAGAVIDRSGRRRMLILANCAAAIAVLAMAALLFAGVASGWQFYVLVAWLSMAAMWQRLSFLSAAPQLVPKRYLGHANGLVQMSTGLTQFLVPLAAVALMAAIGLRWILILDLISYLAALLVLAAVRFPGTMALRRRESIGAEIVGGARFSFRRLEFRAMLYFFAALNLFLFPLLYLIAPLVLSFASLDDVATVAITGGLGGAAGGLIMLVWGGPRRLRMRGVLLATFGIAAGGALIGSRPDLLVLAAGVFTLYCSLAVVNGIYTTIVHTKVPQRFHARVFALNQMVAFSTLPLGWGLLAPLLTRAAEPLLLADGALAPTVGLVIGVGPGRGTALVYIVFGLCVALVAAVSLSTPRLARFDRDVRDAPPDDVVGIEALQRRPAQHDRRSTLAGTVQ